MKKRWIIILIIVGVLLIIRWMLPGLMKNLANKKLKNLNDYQGIVEDIDLRLFRGAYIIDSLTIIKKTDSIPEPFIAVEKVEISLSGEAVLKGRWVSDILITGPDLNFVVAGSGKEKLTQFGKGVDWFEQAKKASPLDINKVVIRNGNISYKDFTRDPQIVAVISTIHVESDNLANVETPDEALPGWLNASGLVLDQGSLELETKLNILKEVPDGNINLQLKNISLPNLNDLMRNYLNLDASKGNLSISSEIKLKDKQLDGYIRLIADSVEMIRWKREEEPFTDKLWESIVGGLTELFSNQEEDRIATEIPLSGDLENAEAEVMPAVWAIFQNAFSEAIDKSLKNSVQIEEGE